MTSVWPNSVLDTDLYKLTMQCAVQAHYPEAQVSYIFINRAKDHQRLISLKCFELIKLSVSKLEKLALTSEERTWLEDKCPYFPKSYLDYLTAYRFKPVEHLVFRFVPQSEIEGMGELEITISGLWLDTILYEVPLLAIISAAYFETVDRDWTYDGQLEAATHKAIRLLDAGCKIVEFGTRRRRSIKAQRLVIEGLMTGAKKSRNGTFAGTSNVYFAMHYGLQPVGTIAHEFVMAEAAMGGYHGSNIRTLEIWERTFGQQASLLVALTDTFSTRTFFAELASDPERARRWTGLRQDSGDPKQFVIAAKKFWQKVGIEPKSKLIVFSDGLNVDRCLELRRFCEEEGVNESYGIGTHFTNDFKRISQNGEVAGVSKALNIVIKLSTVNQIPCIKLSDDLSKTIGLPETVEMVKRCFDQ
ncbi:hypothetical protein CROQUDRAFT_712557 [Cronartium quercuum f. sp. fusiforme G11]|uniref:Nicotinate phosphoribosyltransferase n=1 Tax=Cronartium quercuum f. sp. fusiforme G11 TaxID=708437 RepID=A0A9P6NX03_9BASI|nr:hypothetical protein CROQUDRAFT_712557 [Cronartium quercuum f. sp. fusiforme G11]